MNTSPAPVPFLDLKSFEALFREYFYSLLGFAIRKINDREAARDIVQNVFISLWEKREDLDLSKPLKSYLFTSVNNRCLNFIRDHKKFIRLEHQENPALYPEPSVDPDLMEEAELDGRIKKLLDSLPEGCRNIFMMSRFDGLKYREIALKLNISEKTVETQVSRALKIFREGLKGLALVFLFLINFFWVWIQGK